MTKKEEIQELMYKLCFSGRLDARISLDTAKDLIHEFESAAIRKAFEAYKATLSEGDKSFVENIDEFLKEYGNEN